MPYSANAYVEDDDEIELAQVYLGSRSKPFGEDTQEFKDALKEAQKYLTVAADKIDVNSFPKSFRWDDINGYDFTGRHMVTCPPGYY